MRDAFRIMQGREGFLACCEPFGHSKVRHLRLRVMRRQQSGLDAHHLRQVLRDREVELAAPPSQERLVSRILYERVLESVSGLGRRSDGEDQLARDQLLEGVVERVIRHRRYRSQQFVRELTADARADLRHLPHRRKTIQTRHERVMQRGGDGQVGQRPGQCIRPVGPGHQAALDHRLGQFLDEQRHAVRLRDDQTEYFLRKWHPARDPLDHGRRLAAPKPRQREWHDVVESGPGQVVLRTMSHHHQDAMSRGCGHQEIKRPLRRWCLSAFSVSMFCMPQF